MKHLFKCLDDCNYDYKFRIVGEYTTVQHIFWAQPKYVKLFKNFYCFLCVNLTYKINRYKISLFEIVGIISRELTYCADFVV
jgi:hypothetical protein